MVRLGPEQGQAHYWRIRAVMSVTWVTPMAPSVSGISGRVKAVEVAVGYEVGVTILAGV
jgi:hypothetical protein